MKGDTGTEYDISIIFFGPFGYKFVELVFGRVCAHYHQYVIIFVTYFFFFCQNSTVRNNNRAFVINIWHMLLPLVVSRGLLICFVGATVVFERFETKAAEIERDVG